MNNRVPPNDLEAEKSVLGAGLLSKEALSNTLSLIKPEDFYSPQHREIYAIMMDLLRLGQPVDVVTLSEELKKNNLLEKVGGRAYLTSLTANVPSVVNAPEYAKIVAEKATLRSLIMTADDIMEKSYDENEQPSELLDYAEKRIFEIAQKKQNNDYTHISPILTENIDRIEKAAESKGQVTGLPTGYKRFDELTSGLQKSDLIVLAARPAMGKTAFALNIALNAAKKADASVLIFSLEMSKEQLGQRLLSIESSVEMQKLKMGNVERTDWDSIHTGIDRLAKTKIHIDDNAGVGIMEMKNKCRRLKAEKGLDLVVIDYLQLMQGDGKNESRQNEVSTISRYLKIMAREIDCPVIVLSQLSRAPEQRADHRPILSDLRESGAIEQDADMVIFLYRDDYYNPEGSEKEGICEVNLAKHRSGPTEKIELAWVKKYTRFSDPAF